MSSSQGVEDVLIEHGNSLVQDFKRLLLSPEAFSDVTLIVESTAIPAHRVILANRSEYFRAMLFGGMRETTQKQIELKETELAPFKILLQYIYTGSMNLSKLKVEVLVGVLALANKYQFLDLERDMIFHMKNLDILNGTRQREGNVCYIYQVAYDFELNDLTVACAKFIDRCAPLILDSREILQLSSKALHRLLLRDSLCAREIDIFKMVRRWTALTDDTAGVEIVLGAIRWGLLTNNELVTDVRDSELLPSEKILDILAKKIRGVGDPLLLPHRGFLDAGVNVASTRFGALVIKGEVVKGSNSLVEDGEDVNYDPDRGAARHVIDSSDKDACIIVKLGMPCIINHVRFLLLDKDPRICSSYYLELSIDGKHWSRTVDYSSFLCRSWQELYFSPCTVEYIKVVGTMNSNGRYVSLIKLEAFWMENVPKTSGGIIVPVQNVASVAKNAAVIEGVSRTRNALINNGALVYDWDNGYTCHQIGSGCIVVHFNQPYSISTLRMLLWDIDDRLYTYVIATSTNNRDWVYLLDTKNEPRRSWQSHKFSSRICSYIRLTGISNTANEVFHVVHLEAPDQSSPLIKDEAEVEVPDVHLLSLNEPDVLFGNQNQNDPPAPQIVGELVAPSHHRRSAGASSSRHRP